MTETVKRKRIVRLRRSERLSLQICIGAVLIVVIGVTLVPFFSDGAQQFEIQHRSSKEYFFVSGTARDAMGQLSFRVCVCGK